MSKYINADDCYKYFYEHLNDEAMPGAMNAIEEMPEGIVRCKDCKKFKNGICYDENGLVVAGDDDYCSYGKRRESE